MNKKGSHVGMMLSFVIFVTFLVFLYSVLYPMVKIGQDKKLILDNLILELSEMLDSDYTSGSIKTLDSNFVAEINELANRYDSDYGELKTELKISDADEFGFIFEEEAGATITAEKDIPSINVYAKKIPVYYVGGEENVLLGFITLKVW